MACVDGFVATIRLHLIVESRGLLCFDTMEPCLVRFNRVLRHQRHLFYLPNHRRRLFSSSLPRYEPRIFQNATSLSTIPICPECTCECAETPAMPEGLEIDHTSKLEGTMATYDVHLILHTSVTDWPSRVEDDERFPEVKLIKNMLGKNGEYFNVSDMRSFPS